LGEFSPIEQLFALGSLLKFTEVGKKFGATFSHRERYICINIGLGYILGYIFINSSGHPALRVSWTTAKFLPPMTACRNYGPELHLFLN
jgi:hypothetical protein